jgi:hypothetical protein
MPKQQVAAPVGVQSARRFTRFGKPPDYSTCHWLAVCGWGECALLEIVGLTPSTYRGDLRPLHPDRCTRIARWEKDSGCHRGDRNTGLGTPSCKSDGIFVSTPTTDAEHISLVSFSVSPGQCREICPANAPAKAIAISDRLWCLVVANDEQSRRLVVEHIPVQITPQSTAFVQRG